MAGSPSRCPALRCRPLLTHDWVLTPALLGRTAQMNRVAVFAGLLFWSWMWGIWGTLFAVPVMMVVKVICDHVEDCQPVADFLSESPAPRPRVIADIVYRPVEELRAVVSRSNVFTVLLSPS
jgi:AI-2E family transporter